MSPSATTLYSAIFPFLFSAFPVPFSLPLSLHPASFFHVPSPLSPSQSLLKIPIFFPISISLLISILFLFLISYSFLFPFSTAKILSSLPFRHLLPYSSLPFFFNNLHARFLLPFSFPVIFSHFFFFAFFSFIFTHFSFFAFSFSYIHALFLLPFLFQLYSRTFPSSLSFLTEPGTES